jgi:hypothetical protein
MPGRVLSKIAFHEKAGRSQVGSSVFSLDKVSSPAEWPLSPCFHSHLFPALSDQPHLARMGHDHLVSQLAEQGLIQGECVPVSNTIRLRRMLPNTSRKALAFVRTRCSSSMWPASAAVLAFFIAGLFFICALSTSITWERTPHTVRRPALSSHLITIGDLVALR